MAIKNEKMRKRDSLPILTLKKRAHQSSWEFLHGPGVKSVPIRFLCKPTQLIRALATADA